MSPTHNLYKKKLHNALDMVELFVFAQYLQVYVIPDDWTRPRKFELSVNKYMSFMGKCLEWGS